MSKQFRGKSFQLLAALFVSTLSDGGVSASPVTPTVASFPVQVNKFAVDPIRPRIYATNYATNTVSVFNTSSLSLEATIPVGGEPFWLAISGNNSKLFVANQLNVGVSYPDYIISVIDLDSLAALPALHIRNPPYDLEDGLDGRLYISVSDHETTDVIQVDDSTGEFQSWLGIPNSAFSPHLEISPDRTTLYSAITYYGKLTKFDVSTPTPTVIGQSLDAVTPQITLSHDGSFVCYAATGAVALSSADFSVKGTFPTDYDYPLVSIALSSDDTVAYQLDEEPNLHPGYSPSLIIHLWSTTTFRILDTIIVQNDFYTSLPSGMASDNAGHYLFVANPFETIVYDVSPRIEKPAQVIGLTGSPFAYQCQVTFDPTAFSAASLPPGLAIDDTGLISGIPTESGTFATTITASRDSLQVSQTIDFRIDGTRLKNISTRAYVQPDEKTLIGGFIIDGTAAKKVVVRILGPSLANYGVFLPDPNPAFRLYDSAGLEVIYNNDWAFTDDMDLAALEATGLAPTDPVESAVVTTLDPGAYTAVVEPGGGGSNTDFNGSALFEVYDIDESPLSRLANVSSRAYAAPLNPEIAGVIVSGPGADNVLIRGLGPSLATAGVPNALADPTLELHDSQGVLIIRNDDWRDTQEAEIAATGIPPTDDLEAAIFLALPNGAYTAVLQNSYASTGVCLVEVYHLP